MKLPVKPSLRASGRCPCTWNAGILSYLPLCLTRCPRGQAPIKDSARCRRTVTAPAKCSQAAAKIRCDMLKGQRLRLFACAAAAPCSSSSWELLSRAPRAGSCSHVSQNCYRHPPGAGIGTGWLAGAARAARAARRKRYLILSAPSAVGGGGSSISTHSWSSSAGPGQLAASSSPSS